MTDTEKNIIVSVLGRSSDLTPVQRLVVVLYALSSTDRGGVVRKTGQDLAAELGMTPSTFSRTRKQLVDAGWLELSEKFAHIAYYRLAPRALGESTVVQMRPAM
ncbi:helix-turn-helix domain-containing protein [Streptacidiphilus sp. EB129]|uniref:helix-turn-helix domain-containing protein n=1 Tax=Streptacidiphilus sp. EB129 TaxID=3156262 RepID=UPI0035135654